MSIGFTVPPLLTSTVPSRPSATGAGTSTPRLPTPVAEAATLVGAVPEPPPVPIAESSDHEVKIFEVNPAGDTFCIGDDWTVKGEKLGYDEDAQTGIRSVEVRFGEDQVMYLPIPTALPLATTEFELPTWGEVPEGVEPGEHDADLVFERVKSNVVTDRLTVPLKVTVRE